MSRVIGVLSLNGEFPLIWLQNKKRVWEAYFVTTAYLMRDPWRTAHTVLNDYSVICLRGQFKSGWMLGYLNVTIILKRLCPYLKKNEEVLHIFPSLQDVPTRLLFQCLHFLVFHLSRSLLCFFYSTVYKVILLCQLERGLLTLIIQAHCPSSFSTTPWDLCYWLVKKRS